MRTVLITGGTGSFGRVLAKKLLQTDVEKVIIFSRDEWKQWEMRRDADPRMRFFLGDVRDRDRLRRAFRDVDVVIHAAALKQVDTAEYNPTEFVQTNVLGSMQVIEAALDCGVQKVLALSTDKAVNPANLYGATKLCADKLFVAANVYSGGTHPRFSVVRYGNVLGSRGSVLSHWRHLLDQGAQALPVTDERMTRFWITLDQTVAFVLRCLEWMEGGEIFVPKIPSMKLVDLAEALCPGIEKCFTGIRPGEKLHELLISREDGPRTLERPDHFVIGTQPIGHDFTYSSDQNDQWLTLPEISSLIAPTHVFI